MNQASEVVESHPSESGPFGKHAFIVVAFVALILIVMMFPTVLKSHKKSEMTQAISNSKQVYLIILEFESDYGNFPDDQTAAKTAKLHAFHGPYSNDCLGQLIAGGYTNSEEIFHAFDKRYRKKPNDVISPPDEILQKGECGFGYVLVEDQSKNMLRGLSSSDNGGLPILVAPLVDSSGHIEPQSYENRGIYLRVDGSVRSERLDSQNNMLGESTPIFEAGESSLWGRDLTPVILLPER